jgi:hypothetical protein
MTEATNKFYDQEITADIEYLFSKASSLNDKINSLKSNDDSLWNIR